MIKLLLDLIAPETCAGCQSEGKYLCDDCRFDIKTLESSCFVCQKPSVKGFCGQHSSSALLGSGAVSEYGGVVKGLVNNLKFNNQKGVAEYLAGLIDDNLALPEGDIAIVHIPTSNSQVRLRGYDQAFLIARALAKLKGCSQQKLLYRLDSGRQLGKKRSERIDSRIDFRVKKSADLGDKTIILVDDVITTGSTAIAAIKALERAGYKNVYLCAVARVALN